MSNKKRGMILIDFDGTIVQHSFPGIGEPLPLAFEVMAELQQAGWELILWTCREDEARPYLTEAVEFCLKNGIEFDAINETIHERDFRPEDSLKRKPHAHYVIDDRNFGGFPGWEVIRKVILEGKPINWNIGVDD